MKIFCLAVFCLLIFSLASPAQTPGSFDITAYQAPANWNKEQSASSVNFSTEDRAAGTYCLITLFKSLPGTDSGRENFNLAWQSVVRPTVGAAAAPEMIDPVVENGWEFQSGFAPFEKAGEKGLALLVTISGSGKMVNVLILTNTQAYQPQITRFLESLSLKKPAAEAQPERKTPIQSTPAVAPAVSNPNGYAFTTTNFDDGWTGTMQENWVQVAKGNLRVLIHYPNKSADAYNSSVLDGLKNAWDVLVSPRYGSARNFYFRPITGWQPIEYAEADLVENSSGKPVYVVLFKMNYSNGTGRYLEFVAPDKSSFEREFGPYRESTAGWEKMEKMANYNKFAVAASDLKGKWSNDYSGSLSYVNAVTGASAGTNTQASIENFSFEPGNTYRWDLGVASGYVGSIKFQSVKSSGRFSVPNVWQVTFSSIENKPRTFNAHFSCVKGARILWLDGKAFARLQ